MYLSSSVAGALLLTSIYALSIDVSDEDSVKSAAEQVAKGVIAPYDGDKPGFIPGIYSNASSTSDTEYFWWLYGAIWDTMVEYSYLTDDHQYDDIVEQALAWQIGPNGNFMPPNETASEGNADQAAWALAAMTADERGFTAIPSSNIGWLDLAQNVFDTQAARWDTNTCGGGLREEIFTFNNGYNIKDSTSNGFFFELAARLYFKTGNQTYASWAEKSFNWANQTGLISADGKVYSYAQVEENCTASSIDQKEWTVPAGAFLYGSAVMANKTGSASWLASTNTFLSSISDVFFKDQILTEVACETNGTCTVAESMYKGMLARDMARVAVLAPSTESIITPLLQSTTKAVASIGCKDAENCESTWSSDGKQQLSGLGPQYSALTVIQGNLAAKASLSSAVSNGGSNVTGSTTSSGSSSSTPTSAAAGLQSFGPCFVALVVSGLFVFGIS